MADRGIKCAAALFRYSQRKLYGLVKERAHANGLADLSRELHQFAAALESRATLLHAVKPIKRTIDCVLPLLHISRILNLADHVNGYERPHQGFGAEDLAILSLWPKLR